MFRLKPQTAYNSDYHKTLFLMAIIIIALHNDVDMFQPTIISVKYMYILLL